LQIVAGDVDQRDPEDRSKGFPLDRIEQCDLVVSVDDVVILSAPRKAEVGDTMIEMGELEVEDTRKSTVDKSKVPGREIAMDEDTRSVGKT